LSYTILIVDDSEVVRQSLRSAIELNPDWEVCGEAENGAVALEMVRKFYPDVVILDLHMPVMDGLEAAPQIVKIAPNTVLLMFTLNSSQQLSQIAKTAGIHRVLSKSDGSAAILASLQEVSLIRQSH
jgi:DNA-binding NarL/FixJ family response regulator